MIAGISEIAVAWWGWMGSMLWQVSLLIVLISAIDLLVGKWVWPQVRYALWLLVLVKLLIPPSWALPTSLISPTLPWAQAQIARLGAPESESPETQWTTDEPSPPGASAEPPSTGRVSPQAVEGARGLGAAPPRLAWQAFAMGIWLLGMGLFLVLLLTRIAKLRRWHQEQEERRTIPVWFHQVLVQTGRRLGIERLPAIVFSDEAVTPAVYASFVPSCCYRPTTPTRSPARKPSTSSSTSWPISSAVICGCTVCASCCRSSTGSTRCWSGPADRCNTSARSVAISPSPTS
jgi:beta-lactamase regulating signal transducer with metallopeptidase domain